MKDENCPDCNGKGTRKIGVGTSVSEPSPCGWCAGSGKLRPCPECRGRGVKAGVRCMTCWWGMVAAIAGEPLREWMERMRAGNERTADLQRRAAEARVKVQKVGP